MVDGDVSIRSLMGAPTAGPPPNNPPRVFIPLSGGVTQAIPSKTPSPRRRRKAPPDSWSLDGNAEPLVGAPAWALPRPMRSSASAGTESRTNLELPLGFTAAAYGLPFRHEVGRWSSGSGAGGDYMLRVRSRSRRIGNVGGAIHGGRPGQFATGRAG